MVANVWSSASSHVNPFTAVTAAGTGETFKNITAGAGPIATAAAVIIVGGFWAYFKFVMGRTFKPQLSIEMAGQWRVTANAEDLFHVRIRVTNIGASKMHLLQEGTGSGLRISFPAPEQPAPPGPIKWTDVPLAKGDPQSRVLELLKEHKWIEPGETVADDLLLNLGTGPRIAMLELCLSWKRPGRWWWRREVDVFARQIIPHNSTMIDTRDNTARPGHGILERAGETQEKARRSRHG